MKRIISAWLSMTAMHDVDVETLDAVVEWAWAQTSVRLDTLWSAYFRLLHA
jgi:hypothetical protein